MAPQLMDPLDVAMMAAEVLSNPMHVGAVLLMSRPDDAGADYIDDLHRETLAAAGSLDPRLCRYPHRDLASGGVWMWQHVEPVDLSEHCRRMTLPPGSGRHSLWQLISELHAEPLDRSRPMWMSYLIDGLDDGRFALYVKVHHTVMDGVAGIQLITDGLSTDPRCRSMPAFFTASADRRTKTSADDKGKRVNPLHALRDIVNTAVSGAVTAERLIAGEVATVVQGLISDTTVPPLAAPYTRFNGRLRRERAVAADSWPKERIRAIQAKAEVTGNDVVIAVVSGVLRSWLLARDELPRSSLVALCPITARHSASDPNSVHGNMFGGWLCPLGTNVADPAERLALIHRSMSEGKRQVASRGPGLSMLLLAPSIAPTVLLPMLPLAPKVLTGYNLPISHVPGPKDDMYWNGAHVDGIYPVSTVYDGQALNVTTCSYAGRVCFGYVAGRDVMPDIDTVIPLTEQSLTELEAAVGIVP